MKRIISLITVLCIVLSSFSFCFGVDWSSTDQQNLQNAANRLYYNGYSATYYLYQLVSHMSTIEGYIDQIEGFLQYGGHNISYWVNSISTWMSPIYNAILNIPGLSDLTPMIIANSRQAIPSSSSYLQDYLHEALGNQFAAGYPYGYYELFTPQAGGTYSSRDILWSSGTPLGNIAVIMKQLVDNNVLEFGYTSLGYNSAQNALNWGSLTTSSFTPSSSIDGIYKWFSAIQAPVARLSYVLANQEDIEAREAASANQQAVVDNFIDSSGDGSASPSDIGSISDLSSGYKSNFGSDASVSGIFNIFNSNNMGWFSQETANQLDTTTPTRRGSSFETPLLDQQIDDIYDQIGVKHD